MHMWWQVLLFLGSRVCLCCLFLGEIAQLCKRSALSLESGIHAEERGAHCRAKRLGLSRRSPTYSVVVGSCPTIIV